MKFFPILMVVLCLCRQGQAASGEDPIHAMRYAQELEYPLPSCEGLDRSRALCERLREARERAQGIDLAIVTITETRTVGKKVVSRVTLERHFGVVAYDPTNETWHDIVLAMPLVGNSTFQPRVVGGNACQVTRIKGQTFNKMIFAIRCDGQELHAYASRHLSITPNLRSAPISVMMKQAERVTYLATPPYLVNEEFARLGKEYVLEVLAGVLRELREQVVPSRAYRGRLVADVITPEMLLNLLVIEQTDPCLLQDREPGCVNLLPKLLYPLDEQVADAVLTEFVLNGLEAYRYICSMAAACGAFQFTNNKTQAFGGTYNMVQNNYPGAQLDPSFTRGTRSFRNSAKAAALLIDLELASPGTPEWVRQMVMKDERIGLIFPAAAYNGGASQSRKLARLVTEYRQQHDLKEIFFETFPWQQFFAWVKGKREVAFKAETLDYVKKSIRAWIHLNRWPRPEPDTRMENF